MALLEVDDLDVRFYTEDGVVKATDNLSYRVERGEKFGVVGESGAGKSVTSLAVMRLIDNPGRIEGGSVRMCDDGIVDEFAAEFPEAVVDLADLRAANDLASVVASMDATSATAATLTGHKTDADRDPSDVVDDVRMEDVVNSGYAAEIGLIDADDFVVRDGETGRGFVELTRASKTALRMLRGNHIAMVFQDAETALNPVYTIGEQIAEAVRTHMDVTDEEAKRRAIEMLDTVGIPDPVERYSDYPHQFSGGMQQRAVIAIALSCEPDLLIADEPTTALDVTIEAQILELLEELAEEFDTAIQIITHDLGVVAEVCDRVMVMYAGKPVEKAPVEDLYYDPKHPYTVGLMGSIPRIGDDRQRLDTIPGTMPDLIETPPGCAFHPRCPYAEEVCTLREPPLLNTETGEHGDRDDPHEHAAACLEYSGDLEVGLTYDVTVRDDDGGRVPGREVIDDD